MFFLSRVNFCFYMAKCTTKFVGAVMVPGPVTLTLTADFVVVLWVPAKVAKTHVQLYSASAESRPVS